MDGKRKDFFWPSYVDLLTALFAVVLVLFILSYFNFKNKRDELEDMIQIYKEDSEILNKVKSNLKLFDSDKEIFHYDTVFNRIQIAFEIKFNRGFEYWRIDSNDLESDYIETTQKLNSLGKKLNQIILLFNDQKNNDPSMKDISYLMVISGSASKYGDEFENYLLSYKRALSLYNYWKDDLGIDFNSPKYHEIIELQVAGIGTGGVGRYNYPYNPQNSAVEEKNQRFIIYITPKIGK
jgi:hypothetical protein